MKKLMIALVALVSLSMVAMANNVMWMAAYGVFAHDSAEVVVDNDNYTGVAQDTSVLWQLIYAGANNKIDPIDYSNAAGGYVSWTADGTFDDVVLGSREIAKGGSGAWDDCLYTENTTACLTELDYVYDASTPYYVFQRVYEGTTPTAATPYFESELNKLTQEYDDGVQVVYVEPASTGYNYGVRTSVPEPATMSLLGLGALAMVLRRKLRK